MSLRRLAAITALSSSRRGAPSITALSASQDRARSAVACYRGGSLTCWRSLTHRGNRQKKLWDFVEYVDKAGNGERFVAKGTQYSIAIVAGGVAMLYVDRCIQQDGSMGVNLEQKVEDVYHESFATSVQLQSSLESLREAVLGYKEDTMHYGHQVLGAAEHLKKNEFVVEKDQLETKNEDKDHRRKTGYVLVPKSGFSEIKNEVNALKNLLHQVEVLHKVNTDAVIMGEDGSKKNGKNSGGGGNSASS